MSKCREVRVMGDLNLKIFPDRTFILTNPDPGITEKEIQNNLILKGAVEAVLTGEPCIVDDFEVFPPDENNNCAVFTEIEGTTLEIRADKNLQDGEIILE